MAGLQSGDRAQPDVLTYRLLRTMVASRRLAGSIVAAALQDPKQVAVTMPLTASAARFVRMRSDEAHPKIPWQVTDVAVRVSRSAE